MTSLRHLRIFIRLFAGVFFFLFTLNLSAQSKRDLTKDSPFLPPGYRQHLEKKTRNLHRLPKPHLSSGRTWSSAVISDWAESGVSASLTSELTSHSGSSLMIAIVTMVYTSLNLITRMVAYRLSKMVTKNPYPYPVHLGTHCPSPI